MNDPHGTAVDSPYLVKAGAHFRAKDAPTRAPDDGSSKRQREKQLHGLVTELEDLQHTLYADSRYAVLLVFQAMDAAGKDSTIRAVLSGVDPAGCVVHSFKRPSIEELSHDFLWRTTCRLPARGQIGVFNRSYYEEVLVTRVNPQLLAAQNLPQPLTAGHFWKQRFESIRDHEKHLARSGTVVIKFWLNVSRDEQRKRFLARLDEPEKNWKFEGGDLDARDNWRHYMAAYQHAINGSSRPWAPWYAVPADSKSAMRVIVADIIVRTLRSLDLRYPKADEAQVADFDKMRERLLADE